MVAQRSLSVRSSSTHSASKLDKGDLTEHTGFSSRKNDECEMHEIEPQIFSTPSIRQCKTLLVAKTEALRSLLSHRVVKSKKCSNTMSQSASSTDEQVRHKSHRRAGKSSSGNDVKNLPDQGKKIRPPKRSDSISLRGEIKTTPNTSQSGMHHTDECDASKQSNSVSGGVRPLRSITDWEDEYHNISALESDEEDAVLSFKKLSLENLRASARSRNIVSQPLSSDLSPRRTVRRVSSTLEDEMWTQYDLIIAGDVEEKNSNSKLTKEEGKEKKKKTRKSSSIDNSPRRNVRRASSTLSLEDELWAQYDQITSGDSTRDFKFTNEEGKEKRNKTHK